LNHPYLIEMMMMMEIVIFHYFAILSSLNYTYRYDHMNIIFLSASWGEFAFSV
jgi:hypothetical protein